MTLVHGARSTREDKVVKAWLGEVSHGNLPRKRRRITPSAPVPLKKLDNNMAGRSGAGRRSPKKKLIDQEESLRDAVVSAASSTTSRPLRGRNLSVRPGASSQSESLGAAELSLPTSSYAKALSQSSQPIFGETSSKAYSTRSVSPVKTTTTLQRLPKPVLYGQLRKTSQLMHVSELIHDLDASIEAHWNRGNHFDIKYCEDPGAVEWKTILAEDDPRDSFSQEFEFSSVEEILSCASRLEDTNAAEPAWNDEVHSAVLKIALSQKTWRHPASARIGYSNVTTAQIAAAFRPTSESSSFQTNQIDYCIHVEPSPEAQSAIKSVLDSLPPTKATVNQTLYSPLVKRPIFVSIETKAGQSFEDKGKAQLGMWTDAGHRRAKELQEFTTPPIPQKVQQKGWTHISEPLILIIGHSWDLYITVDTEENINALKYRQPLGTTRSIGSIYQLLAALRCLARWGVERFCPWWEENVLNLNTNL